MLFLSPDQQRQSTEECLVDQTIHTPYLFNSSFFSKYLIDTLVKGWWRGTVVERRSLTGELSLSCA